MAASAGRWRPSVAGPRREAGRPSELFRRPTGRDANPHVDTAVATGLGHARNALVPLNGEGVIALSGGPGTLTEIGFALVSGRPVVGIDSHEVQGVEAVGTPAEAVDAIEAAVGRDDDRP